MDVHNILRKQSKVRGRPHHKAEVPAMISSQETSQDLLSEDSASGDRDETADPISPSSTGGSRTFAILFGFFIKKERSENFRLAREIGVSDNTGYRLINSTSEPQLHPIQRPLDVLPHTY